MVVAEALGVVAVETGVDAASGGPKPRPKRRAVDWAEATPQTLVRAQVNPRPPQSHPSGWCETHQLMEEAIQVKLSVILGTRSSGAGEKRSLARAVGGVHQRQASAPLESLASESGSSRGLPPHLLTPPSQQLSVVHASVGATWTAVRIRSTRLSTAYLGQPLLTHRALRHSTSGLSANSAPNPRGTATRYRGRTPSLSPP